MQELIKALIKAKAEFNPIQKDGTNPHYKRKYATLDAVLYAVTPALGKHGLVIIQTTEIFEGQTVLRTHIFHQSGESITSTYPSPEIADSQKFGAALTYARRYAVCAILSVTADEDNDAESATTPYKPEQPHNNIRPRKDNQQYRIQPTKQAVTPPSISPKDLRVKEVRTLLNYPLNLVKEWLHFQNVTSPSELDSAQIDELVKTMCLAWAGNKFGHPDHAVNSYQKNVMETSKVVTIPNHWTSPKYSLGQRTKQGVIVGIQYYPPNNLLTGLCNESWRYAVLNKNDLSEVSHLEEQKIHPLTSLELCAELEAEIEAYQRKILILKQQLETISNA